MTVTSIEWAEWVWNCLAGCTRVSQGCVHCYAERMAWRHVLMCRALGRKCKYEGTVHLVGGEPRWTGVINFDEDALLAPLRRTKPTTWFVNSMSDQFHDKVLDEWIAKMFAVMALCPQHTFKILTKRPERMRAFLAAVDPQQNEIHRHLRLMGIGDHPRGETRQASERIAAGGWPLPNVWLGISAEDQPSFDERAPHLFQTPAAVRWVSYEPGLGAIDFGLNRWVRLHAPVRTEIPFLSTTATAGISRAESNPHGALSVRATDGTLLGIKPDEFERLPQQLDWIVVGGESGPGARPFDLAWARSTVAQGRAAGVPVFVKQAGAKPYRIDDLGDVHMLGFRDRKGGDMAEWPADLRVREFPRG